MSLIIFTVLIMALQLFKFPTIMAAYQAQAPGVMIDPVLPPTPGDVPPQPPFPSLPPFPPFTPGPPETDHGFIPIPKCSEGQVILCCVDQVPLQPATGSVPAMPAFPIVIGCIDSFSLQAQKKPKKKINRQLRCFTQSSNAITDNLNSNHPLCRSTRSLYCCQIFGSFLSALVGRNGQSCDRASIKWTQPRLVPNSKSSKPSDVANEDKAPSSSNDAITNESMSVPVSDISDETLNHNNDADLGVN